MADYLADMRPRFVSTRARLAFRRILVGLCIFAHLALTVGFPLPQVSEASADSRPFPCKHHQCGCRSAEQCWRSCCCMSMREKLAWAKSHGVMPPDYVIQGAGEEDSAVRAPACCQHVGRKKSSCCQSDGDDNAGACCRKSSSSKSTADRPSAKPRRAQTDWVVGIHALKCQGLSLLWVTHGAIVPPPARLELPVETSPPTWCVPRFSQIWQSVDSSPDVPPPRVF